MTFKQQIHERYQQLVQDRIDAFRDRITALTTDAQNDAKGSAGDKHETALSMMHLEQEKLNHKLREIFEQKAVLDRIDPLHFSTKIALGSLVQVNNMQLYISAALPKIVIDGATIIAVSPASPLGSQLMGQQQGFAFEIHGSNYRVITLS